MSGRAQRMEEDVQAVIAACQADQACPFRSESRSKILMYLEPNRSIRSFSTMWLVVSRKEHLRCLFINQSIVQALFTVEVCTDIQLL